MFATHSADMLESITKLKSQMQRIIDDRYFDRSLVDAVNALLDLFEKSKELSEYAHAESTRRREAAQREWITLDLEDRQKWLASQECG